MIKDIKQAKASGKLKRVIISVGGVNNTFKPDGGNMQTLAQNFKKLMDDFAADGINFNFYDLGTTDLTALSN